MLCIQSFITLDHKTRYMKKIALFFGGLLLIAATWSFTLSNKDVKESIAIGTEAPQADLKMSNTDGKSYSLNDLKKQNGLLVIFTCNTCPFVVGAEGYGVGWDGRYAALKKKADELNIGFVLVNSNEAKREKGDNLNDMKERASKMGYGDAMYLLDTNSELADAFGARTTPHVFMFDKNMKLNYKGSIDDSNEGPEKVKEHWLEEAMKNAAANKKISPNETKPVGCSIKRVG